MIPPIIQCSRKQSWRCGYYELNDEITVTKSKLTQQSKSTRELNWPGNGEYGGRKRPNYGRVALRKAFDWVYSSWKARPIRW